MARGGARNRSGPQPDESSATSDRRGYKLTALPAEGFSGLAPTFPLPCRDVYVKDFGADGKPYRRFDAEETKRVRDRELDLWAWLWTTPQACAWSMPSEAWRLHTIAMYVRTFVVCEGSEATAADKGSLHRFADQIGMTTAGLAEMGWKIAVDELADKRETKPAEPAAKPVRRLRAAGDAK